MVDIAGLNPFKNFDIGIGLLGSVLLVLFLAVFILCLVGLLVFIYFNNKQYKHIIPLTKNVGGRTIKVATYKAKDFKIGRAGDKLWFVKGVKKYISPATLQTGMHEFTHHEGSDGEWRNVQYPNVDDKMEEMKVHFVKQDMRAGRIAIADLLDMRFKDKKTFWEQWGNMIMQLIFYLIVAMMMVVIFYQFSDIIEKMSGLVAQLKVTNAQCGGGSIVPAMIFLMLRRRKK